MNMGCILNGLFVTVVAALLVSVANPSLAQTCTQEQVLYANTGGAERLLLRYSPNGDALSSAGPLARDYGDIAVSADGNTLYALTFDRVPTVDGPPAFRLASLDRATGLEISSVVITGLADEVIDGGQRSPNALSVLAGNTLVMGTSRLDRVYRINALTGDTELYATYPQVPAEFSGGSSAFFASAGDFINLNNGDVLALVVAVDSNPFLDPYAGALLRIRSDGSGVVVGRLASTNLYGMARLGERLFFFDANGQITSLDLATLPASGTALLTVTPVASTGRLFYGAGSSGDSGYLDCAPRPIPATGAPALVMLSMLLAALAWRTARSRARCDG